VVRQGLAWKGLTAVVAHDRRKVLLRQSNDRSRDSREAESEKWKVGEVVLHTVRCSMMSVERQ